MNREAWNRIIKMADATRAVRMDAGEPIAKPGAEPKWQRLFPLGVTKHRDDFPGGKLTFSKEWCQKLIDNAKLILGKGHKIQVNYHHLGGEVDPSTPLENTVASGWIQDVKLEADGPYALIAWTERARKFIEAEELLYLSPEFFLDYTNRDTGKKQGPTLVGAALTNQPFLKELPRVAASDTPPPLASAKGARMNLELLRKLLKLSDTATEAECEAKLLSLNTTADKLSLTEREGQLKLTELQQVVNKLTEESNGLKVKLVAVETEKRAGEVKAFVDNLVKAGKVTPAIREDVEKMGLSGGVDAIKFFERAAPVVSLQETGVASGIDSVGGTPADAAKKFYALVDEAQQKKGLDFLQASRTVTREHPELAKLATKIEPAPERV